MEIYSPSKPTITRVQFFGSKTISFIETDLEEVFAIVEKVLSDYIDLERNKTKKRKYSLPKDNTPKVQINVYNPKSTPKSKSRVYWGISPDDAYELFLDDWESNYNILKEKHVK